jgi:HPt (histidine-containing phosphotransfer) domain-containing protein
MGEFVALQEDVLYSSLGGDPDLGELVEMFVDEIPQRVARMRDCMDEGDTDGLRRTAHQLKGAVGSYGFSQLTPALEHLESLARTGGSAIDELWQALEDVADLCGRMRAGVPD